MTTSKRSAKFSSISVIFNPKSTGDGKAMATQLKADLSKSLPGQKVSLVPTKHAGHAEELAYELSKKDTRPLIISASGDGGYHEVVNGIVKANKEGSHAVAGLLPAGNANDHFHDVHKTEITEAISKSKTTKIDLLELTTTIGGKEVLRYAHSYIGFGLTPKVGRDLNRAELNRFNEIIIAAKALFKLKPVKIILEGKQQSYHSLVFSNVGTMSKVLNLSPTASNNDGLFELTIFKRRHKLRLLFTLLKASTTGLADAQSLKEFSFRTNKPLLVQLDGEISTIDANSRVSINIKHRVLECVV